MTTFEKIKQWYDSPRNERDYTKGALFVLQVTMNKILYANIMRNIERHKEDIDYQLSKYIKEHLSDETRQIVKEMRSEVEKITVARNLDGAHATSHPSQRGKRADHDALPDDIKALYVENLSLLQQMRDLHTQLRIIARDPKVTCLDSEQYPFLQDLIAKDKRMRENYARYDSYTAEGEAEAIALQDAKNASLKALRMLNMMKGKYKKNPTEEMKNKIIEQIKSIPSLPHNVTEELKSLGLYEENK